jgi:bifunctional non-homologous end joining protein LigD
MSLQEYIRKRSFDCTREPAPDDGARTQRAVFVVQLHHARHRHYDFRLQIGDALKSWAVPKGPSLDPAVKRMAVEVEDHPLDYADFEGEIPPGQYGAGQVEIFDRGVWSTGEDAAAQYEKGHLRFELYGERLRGSWSLIRTAARGRQPVWLLIKGRDEHAAALEADDLLDDPAAAPHPQAVPPDDLAERLGRLPQARRARAGEVPFAPQLGRLADQAPEGEGWLHEVKWDGYRLLATIVDGRVRLWSRNAIEWTDRLPDIVAALAALGLDDAHFDGELIALREGHSDFNALQATLSGAEHAPLAYVLFDLPRLQGHDLTRVPLSERKALLHGLLQPEPPAHLQYSSHLRGQGAEAFAAASRQGLEGIMCKRADGPYRSGRGDDWLKVKRLDSDEFAIVGYTRPKGSRTGFGSLLLARPEGDGWRYVGRVGSGFSDRQLRELAEELLQQAGDEPTVRIAGIDPLLREARWVAPQRVAEVYFRGIGRLGLLRHPSLKALRPDKTAADLRNGDRPAPTGSTETAMAAVKISNPERVIFPARGITKQQIADYYAAVMDWLLPGIIGRPLSIVRCPGGIAQKCFFQKHRIAGLERVSSVKLKEESGVAGDYLYVESADAVLELVQFGAVEFHPWGSTVATPEIADRVVFDLDPGPGVAFRRVAGAARQVCELLRGVGLRSFLRATGGKGLHVVVPLDPAAEWTIVKPFARAVAEALARAEPEQFVASASKKQREGRIFVDYLRNGRGATAVASYSLRARPGAPVAVPLRWSELSRIASADRFDIDSVRRRLARLDADPWEAFASVRQDLRAIGAERLQDAGKS